MISVSVVPVFILAVWVQRSALQDEIEAVSEKHLLIARNLSGVLSRYVRDVEEGFRVAVKNGAAGTVPIGLDRLLRSVDMQQLEIVDRSNAALSVLPAPPAFNWGSLAALPELPELKRQALAARGEVAFTDLMRCGDVPIFFILQALPDGRIAIGVLGTRFLRHVQRAIAFGERGHSMMVDARGRVIAHPNKAWEDSSKDASKLSVVGKMMRGETGVATFYSPPMQAEMIAGHTSVPKVGWGVMVPQPMDELVARAGNATAIAFGLSVMGLFVAGFISWWLAKFLAKPIVAVSDAAVAVAAEGRYAGVAAPGPFNPRELADLSRSFNRMLDELRRREQGLREAKNHAELASRAKTDFLANMSHELRTPLNAIIGFSEMIKKQSFGPIGSPTYVEYVDDIYDSGRHLLGVINDILDMSRVEAGKLTPHWEAVDLAVLVPACLRMVAHRARQGGLTVRSSVAQDLPELWADGRLLKQVLTNLLANAVKFTLEGGTVAISAKLDDAGAHVIEIADSGIGIASEQLDVVMQPFAQVDTALARKYEGTGLGLPLAASITKLLGGKLSIESAPRKGTTVTVRFPAALGPDHSNAAA